MYDETKTAIDSNSDPTTTTDPLNPDSDGDGIPDGIEDKNKNGNVDTGAWNNGDGPGETDPNDADK